MRFDLSSDQEFFRETTARYLDDKAPVTELRRLRTDPIGFVPAYWTGGAELGWTSLLVDESLGGGSISGEPLADLALVAHEFGWHAAPGPFVTTNVSARALSEAGAAHADVVAGLLSGEAIVSWCLGEPAPNDGLGAVGLTVRADGGELVIDGVKRPVESAGVATHFLVVGRTGDGLTQVLVPADAAGITVEPVNSLDLTRRFGTVRFDGVRVPASALVGELGGADAAVTRLLDLASTIQNIESVGAMQRAFDMTVEWAFDRYSFGRPLASYQALKHRFADMKMWLEASHAVTDASVEAIATADPAATELVSAASAYVGHYGSELVQECVQLHGGIGVTYEHDLHLFIRRQAVNRAVFGTPAQHRRRLADLVIEGSAA